MRFAVTCAAIVLIASPILAAEPVRSLPDQGREIAALPAVLPQRARVEAVNRALRERLDRILPALMRESGLDMWLVINREYAEDPVYLTLVPEPVFAARRTTMLVFFDRGEKGIERLTVSRYDLEDFYESAWAGGGSDAEQWTRLAEVIAERNPRKIGIDVSRDWAFGDGLTKGLYDQLAQALPPALESRLVSAETLALRWLETRSDLELEVYPQIVALARGVLAEAFSNRVITPGVTTTDDVAWYIRQRYDDLGLPIWFMPYVNIQRKGDPAGLDEPFLGKEGVILRGDVLHTDVGITYLRLNTDTQEMAYVLRLGESDCARRAREGARRGEPVAGHPDVELRRGEKRQRDPRRDEGAGREGRDRREHLLPSPRLLRPRGRPDDRHVGQPGADADPRRMAAPSRDRVRDRGKREGPGPGVGRAVGAGQAGAVRVLRREEGVVPGGTADGVARDPMNGRGRPAASDRGPQTAGHDVGDQSKVTKSSESEV